jgi:hypothetical protein
MKYGTLFIILSVVVMGLESYRCYKVSRVSGWGGVIEELKWFIDAYKWIFYMIFGLYVFVIMSALTGMVENWADTQNIKTVGAGYIFLLEGIPIMWRLLTVYVLCKIIYSGFKVSFKHKKIDDVGILAESKGKNSFHWTDVIKNILRLWK